MRSHKLEWEGPEPMVPLAYQINYSTWSAITVLLSLYCNKMQILYQHMLDPSNWMYYLYMWTKIGACHHLGTVPKGYYVPSSHSYISTHPLSMENNHYIWKLFWMFLLWNIYKSNSNFNNKGMSIFDTFAE